MKKEKRKEIVININRGVHGVTGVKEKIDTASSAKLKAFQRKAILRGKILLFSIFFLISSFTFTFGFGFDEEEESSPPMSVKASGEVTLEFPFYFKDYTFLWQELARAKLNINLATKYIEAITAFNFSYDSIKELWDSDTYKDSSYTPQIIDEAFLRAYIGQVNIEAGYRKLSWGRADSSGPLDVTNPIDYSDLRHITDIKDRKIARPMLHVTWNTSGFSSLEAVFIPNFAGHRFAQEGRWAPAQYERIPGLIADAIQTPLIPHVSGLPLQTQLMLLNMFNEMSDSFSLQLPDTSSIKNYQTGLRFTTTIGSVDVGFQYYYGNLFRPNFTANGTNDYSNELITWISGGASIPPGPPDLNILNSQLKYTRFHQIGLDYAQVLFGLNARAELALNITQDIKGSDGSLQNPFIAWSLGFDRVLFWGINVNMQCNETIRLFDNKVGNNPLYDAEAGTNLTNTRITTQLSKKFFRDDLETKATVIWDIENADCYIIPSVIYTLHNFTFDLTAGIFAGDKSGELGQYRKNNFIRIGATYLF